MADFQISEELLQKIQNVSDGEENRKGTYSEGKKRKAQELELGSAKKKKEELESVAKRLIDTADKKAKEAEK